MFLAPRGCGPAWPRFGRSKRRCFPCHPGGNAFWAGRLRCGGGLWSSVALSVYGRFRRQWICFAPGNVAQRLLGMDFYT